MVQQYTELYEISKHKAPKQTVFWTRRQKLRYLFFGVLIKMLKTKVYNPSEALPTSNLSLTGGVNFRLSWLTYIHECIHEYMFLDNVSKTCIHIENKDVIISAAVFFAKN